MGSGEEETTGSRTEGCPIVPAMLLMVMGSRLRSLLALTLSGLFFLSGSLPLDVPLAEAMTIETVDFHCPLCATHFRARLAGSGTATGTRLDLQGTGYIAQPWPQLRCPKCNLILFKDFSPRELKAARAFVYSQEYIALVAKKTSTHVLLARLLERIGGGHRELGHAFLAASWGVSPRTEEWRIAMTESLRHFEAFLRAPSRRNAEWATAALLRGEILRQLGRFAEAAQHLRTLEKQSSLIRARHRDYVNQELALIAESDSEPHQIGELPRHKRRDLAEALIRNTPTSATVLKEFEFSAAMVETDDSIQYPSQIRIDRLRPRNAAPGTLEATFVQSRGFQHQPIALDWQVFLDTYRPLAEAVRRHLWIADWVRGGPGRTVRAQIDYLPPTYRPGWSLDWETDYPLLRRKGADRVHDHRRFEVQLICGDKVGAQVWLALDDRRALVSELSGCGGEHFIDRQQPWAYPRWVATMLLYKDYLAIEPDGNYVRNREPVPQVRCPPEMCSEPCKPAQTACSGSVGFSCSDGKIAFFDYGDQGRRPATCGKRPDGTMGELGLEGASCDPLLVPQDSPSFCAPRLHCIKGVCTQIVAPSAMPLR